MNRSILALALFAFLASGFSEVAYAFMPNVPCSHQTIDTTDNINPDCAGNQQQDEADTHQCNECCCVHAHILNGILPNSSLTSLGKDHMASIPHSLLRSKDLSSIQRPPIV